MTLEEIFSAAIFKDLTQTGRFAIRRVQNFGHDTSVINCLRKIKSQSNKHEAYFSLDFRGRLIQFVLDLIEVANNTYQRNRHVRN